MSVASIQSNVDAIVGMLSAATGIPQRILIGLRARRARLDPGSLQLAGAGVRSAGVLR